MFDFIIRRLLMTIPVMLFVAFFIFSLLYLTPGDPAALIAGDQASEADILRIRESLGLDRPYLLRFFEWLINVMHGDLGVSIFSQLPVTTLIAQRLEPTLALMTFTMVISVAVAVPMGVLAASHQGSVVDRLVMAVAVFGFSVPVFALGYLFSWVFALQMGLLPIQGYSPLSEGLVPFLRSLVLPSLSLSCVFVALVARISRTAMIDVLSQDYIRTARAKGLGQWSVLFLHALKNAAIPIVTVIGIGVALLISGAVVTETVFAIPGIGRLVVDAILRRDYPVIQGVILMFSIGYVVINLVVDLIYTVLDPRVRY